MTKKISWLKIAWNLSLLYKKLPEQEKADFMEILDNKDDVGLEHLQKIHNNWEKVRELLTVHYCGLAPYEHMDLKGDDKNVLGKLYSYEM